MGELNKQLKKGVMEILVLKLLSEQDYYGYQLISEIEKRSNGAFALKEGTLYPILYRLEDSGHAMCYWEKDTQDRKMPRKYYGITEKGRARLPEMLDEWRNFILDVYSVLGSTVK